MNDTVNNVPDTPVTGEAAPEQPNYVLPRIFRGKEANKWVKEASQTADPVQLWKSLWFENEVACLFADTNMGKSIYAIQIADAVARTGRRVAYFDFEMSAKQFELRYRDPETARHYQFSDNFLRVELVIDDPELDNAQFVIRKIEEFCDQNSVRTIIIDNISWLSNRFESGDAAGELMQELVALKRRKNMSVLVLAHTPKRNIFSPLTQNSLAGSKRLANFMDSMFAIGKASSHGSEYRYVKQIKIRSGEMEYDADSVILCRLEKEGAFLGFTEVEFADEVNLLAQESDDACGPQPDNRAMNAEKRRQVEQLLGEGVPQKVICARLGVSPKTVVKINRQNISKTA